MTLNVKPGFLWNESIWNPSMIRTALWLDAADASSVTLSNTAVSEWRDKSGNGLHPAQSSASLQPVYSATAENGKASISFNGTSHQLTFPNSTGLSYPLKFGTASFEIFCVNRPTTLSANPNVFFGARAFDTGWMAGYSATNPNMRMFNVSEQWVPSPITSVTATTQLQMFYASAPRGATGAYRTNGNLLQSTTSNVGTSTMDVSGPPVRIGAYSNSDNNPIGWFNGTISELILISGALVGTLERQKLEGYLAHKWGLEASLPVGHPYKTTGPTP
jgi:hypothetical protein